VFNVKRELVRAGWVAIKRAQEAAPATAETVPRRPSKRRAVAKPAASRRKKPAARKVRAASPRRTKRRAGR
jgi:hypothetical protein